MRKPKREPEPERSACEIEEIEVLDAMAATLPPEQRAAHEQFWAVITEPHRRLDEVLRRLGFLSGGHWENLRKAMRDVGLSLDELYSLSPFKALDLLEALAKAVEDIKAQGLRKASPLLRKNSGAKGGRPLGKRIDRDELQLLRRGRPIEAFARVLGMHPNSLAKILITGRASSLNANRIKTYANKRKGSAKIVTHKTHR